MKKIIAILCLLTLGVLIVRCSSGNKKEGGLNVVYADEGKGLENYKAFDLRPYQINALIFLPGPGTSVGSAFDPVISHNIGDFHWDISLGKDFHIHIEDWGNENAFKNKLAALSEQDIFTINFIQKTDSFAYYEKTLNADGIKGRDEVGTQHSTYHVMALHTIDGVNYLFSTDKEGAKKDVASMMAKSVMNVEKIAKTIAKNGKDQPQVAS